MHLQPSLIQNFVLFFSEMGSHFEKLVYNVELKKVGGAPKGHLLHPYYFYTSLDVPSMCNNQTLESSIVAFQKISSIVINACQPHLGR